MTAYAAFDMDTDPPKPMVVSWFSAGVSSFVATWLVRNQVDKIIYIHIDDQHPDSMRFVKDCEKVIGKQIELLQSPIKSVENALRLGTVINVPARGFAPCTDKLKKRVRKEWEILQGNERPLVYVWGMDYEERHRAERIREAMPKQDHRFPLIENEMDKQDAHGVAARLGVKRPAMYDLGYNNNNCIGCVKGGMGYWNKIRKDWPGVFAARAKLERVIGASILKDRYLDELREDAGRESKEILEDCGLFCELALREGK